MWRSQQARSSSPRARIFRPRRCSVPIEPHIGYKPPFLPIQFIVDRSGVKVSGDASFVTPIGTFTIGASLPVVESGSRDIMLVLRDRQNKTDTAFRIREGQGARVVLDGHVEIAVTSTTVVIEVLEGQVVEISAPVDTPEDQATAAAATAIAQAPPVAGQPRLLHKLELDPQNAPENIRDAAFSPDGTLLAVLASTHRGENGTLLYLWRMPGADLVRTAQLEADTEVIQFSPDGQLLVSLDDYRRLVRAWNVADGSLAWTLDEGLGSLAFTPDGQWLVGGCGDCYYDSWLKVWRVGDLSLSATLEWRADQWRVASPVTLSADGRWLAVVDAANVQAYDSGQIRIYDLPARRLVQTWEEHHGGDIVMSPDGTWLAQCDADRNVLLRRVPDGALIRQIEPKMLVRSQLALSPDGAYLAAADDYGSYVWRTADGQMVFRQSKPNMDVSFAFSPEGTLAMAEGKSVYMWEMNP